MSKSHRLHRDRPNRLITAPRCRWCPRGCKSCVPEDCECYTHQDWPDQSESGAARADVLAVFVLMLVMVLGGLVIGAWWS